MSTKKPGTKPERPTRAARPKHDAPHSGVDRRRKDMAGRKYRGTVMTKY